jgi:DNA-binding transcriptional ArsR family regulator
VPDGDVFKALADPTRRSILDELTERDGQTLFEICSRLIMKHGITSSRQAISQHLDLLEAAGLVRCRREGRYKFHHIDPGPLEAIVDRWRAKNIVERPDKLSAPTRRDDKESR